MRRSEIYTERPYGALMLDELEDYQELIEDLSAHIEDNSKGGVAYHNRGLAHWEIGEIEKALADFGKAEELLSGSHMPSQIKGMLLQKIGRLAEAIECLNRAVVISPAEPTVLRTRAHMLVEAGKLEESLRDLDLAIKLQPEFDRTYEDREEVRAQIKRIRGEQG